MSSITLEEINIGAASNDGTGDSPRVAGEKINRNFSELRAAQIQLVDATAAAIAATARAQLIADTLTADFGPIILLADALMPPGSTLNYANPANTSAMMGDFM